MKDLHFAHHKTKVDVYMKSFNHAILNELRDPTVLMYMHEIAEKEQVSWRTHHILISHMVQKALDDSAGALAMLGVEVQEVVSRHMDFETSTPRIVERHTSIGHLIDSSQKTRDLLLDATASFRQVEPTMADAVDEVVGSYTETRSTHRIAMFGASLSYCMQLSERAS